MFKCPGKQLTITQPTIASTYSGEVECAWKIISDSSTMKSVELNIDFKSKCDEEYLIIYNGPYFANPRTRFCGKFSTNNLTNLNGVYIEYYSSKYQIDSKLNVTINSLTDCGGVITAPFRNINFRDIYQNNIECIWDVQAKSGYHISLNFLDRFFIEDSTNCSKDYLLVQDMIANKWTDVARLCGRIPQQSVIESSGSKMRLIFRSDNQNIGDGFTAQFTSVCGGIIRASDIPTLFVSAIDPFILRNVVCNFTIINPTGGNILADLRSFYLYDLRNGCPITNLTITRFNWQYGADSKETFCNKLSNYEIRSGNKLEMVFYGLYSFQFQVSKDICGGAVTTPTVIRSKVSRNDGFHPPNMECLWNITAPVGKKIIVKFIILDMEYHSECVFDNVQLFNGKYPALEERIVNLCGNITSKVPVISIPNRYGLIKSTTDDSSNSKGFTAEIYFRENCDRDILLGLLNLTTHLSIGSFKNLMDCNLKIRGPVGYKLKITFDSFHVQSCERCECDFLEIYDAAGPFGDLIGKFCGDTIPEPIVTSKYSTYLRFVSDQQVASAGINLTITAVVGECGSQRQIVLNEEQVSISRNQQISKDH